MVTRYTAGRRVKGRDGFFPPYIFLFFLSKVFSSCVVKLAS
jgi:hypothetical protein